MLLLDSMHPKVYVVSRNIQFSLLAALCLYNLLSHTRDFAILADAKNPDTLSSSLIAFIGENSSLVIAPDLSVVGV